MNLSSHHLSSDNSDTITDSSETDDDYYEDINA